MSSEDAKVKTEEKTFFARTSSGLVREFGTLDVLLIASAAVFALTYTILQFPWFYGFNPGADLTTALVITGIPFVLLMLIYWAMGVIMPRSGNDYVWVARILHPVVGFAWSFLYMFSVFATAFVGGTAAYASGIATSFAVWGQLYNEPGLVTLGNTLSQPIWGFSLSLLITICFAVLSIVGAKAVKRFLYVVWGIAVVGIALIWGLLATTSPTAFAGKWDSLLSSYTSYNGLTTLATHLGWTPSTITITASVVALPFAALFLLGGNFSNAVAGEIKNAKRALPIALLLSLLLGVVFWSVTSTLSLNAFGANWMYSVGYLWDNQAANYSAVMPIAPTFPLMVSLAAYPSQILVFLVLFTIMAGSLAAPFVYFWIPARYFFAWSFDRIIPSKMASVNKRFRTPHISIITITVLSALIFAAYWFTTWPTAETIGTFLWAFCFVVPGIATIIFPYRMKELFNSSPGWMRSKVGGIPVLSIIGLLTTISFAYIGYLAIANPLIVSLTSYGALVALGVVIGCIVIYYASRSYHKRQGLDTDLAFKEIPPV
jgi:basic amino acid/polyamine antiporter, APA family